MRCHATITRRLGAAATAFAPTAWTIVEQSFGNRQTAMRKHASGSANSWNRMLRKTMDEKTANGAAFFAFRTQGRFSPTTKRVCGITAVEAITVVGVGVGAGTTFFLLNREGRARRRLSV